MHTAIPAHTNHDTGIGCAWCGASRYEVDAARRMHEIVDPVCCETLWPDDDYGDIAPTAPVLAVLIGGHQYTATRTATLQGEPIYRRITFTAARTQLVERHFIDPSRSIPQDRVTITHTYPPTYYRAGYRIDTPALVVSGTIRPAS